MIWYLRNGTFNQSRFTYLGCRWLARQPGQGAILWGSNKGGSADHEINHQRPPGSVLLHSHGKAVNEPWSGGSALAVWTHEKALEKFSPYINRAENVLVLEWVPGELEAWFLRNGAKDFCTNEQMRRLL